MRYFSYAARILRSSAGNLLSRAIGKIPRPDYIVYEVTDACNSRCHHCNIWQNKPTKDMLQPEEIERIFSTPFFRNVKIVLVTGGEAMTRHDIKEVIRAIHKALPQAKITLSTNALLPDKALETIKDAINNGICLSVGISLDAVGEQHDAIRGVKGNFQKADYLIKECLKLKEQYKEKMGIVVAGHTLSSLTAGTLKGVLEYARGVKVNCLTQLYEQFTFYHNIDAEKGDKIENYQQSDNRGLISEIKELPPSFHNEMLLTALTHKLKYQCAGMRKFFLLKCNGDIAPCLGYSHVCAGNIRSLTPDKFWTGQQAKKARAVVDNCRGCSNAWATGWSFENWFPPFIKMVLGLRSKRRKQKLLKRPADNGGA